MSLCAELVPLLFMIYGGDIITMNSSLRDTVMKKDSDSVKEQFRGKKSPLPFITKAAVCFIFVVGATGVITVAFSIVKFPGYSGDPTLETMMTLFLLFITVVAGSLYLIPGFLLITKRKRAYKAAVLMLIIQFIGFGLFYIWAFPRIEEPFHRRFYALAFLLYLIPIILIGLDKKKYWGIAK